MFCIPLVRDEEKIEFEILNGNLSRWKMATMLERLRIALGDVRIEL